jgi:hypothetical protein
VAEDVFGKFAAVGRSDESETARIPPCGLSFEALAVVDPVVFVEITANSSASFPAT